MTDQPGYFISASSAESADVVVSLGTEPAATPLAEWFYAVAAPFPTLTDEVDWSHVTERWAGAGSGPFADQPLLMTEETSDTLAALLGPPAEGAIGVVSDEAIVERAWGTQPAWAIMPFDQLEPRWKVLRLEGHSVLSQTLDAAAYPLAAHVGVSGMTRGVEKLEELIDLPLTNRDPEKMSVLALTGVTALSRCTATTMDREGITYPGSGISHWLTEPDITHISNEVSFAENCPPASCVSTVVFCSDPDYIALFEDLDVDVVELTGNHLLDWGVAAMENSLEMYEARGIPYYGGGWDATQASQPLTITDGVHTFGFVGCNPAGPESDWATDERPGTLACNFGRVPQQLGPQVAALKEEGIIPIVTLQYLETDRYIPTAQQEADFEALAEAGAAIVSGSQAHWPQGFDFHAGAFIHYGLGNLFFDQTQVLAYRQTFVDRHVFYDGRLLSTQLLTALRDDYARPRPMTVEERRAFLSATFDASQW